MSSETDIDVVATVGSGQEVLGVVERFHPDVLVTDIEPTGVSCSDLTRVMHADGGAPPQALIFSEPRDDETVMRCLEAGVKGFLAKDADLEEVPRAIRALSRGEAVLTPPVTRKLLNWFFWREALPGQESRSAATGLSRREREVLRLLASGLSNDEIACKLCLGEATIRTHTYRLRRKLKLKSRAQLISFALRSGLARGLAPRYVPGGGTALTDSAGPPALQGW